MEKLKINLPVSGRSYPLTVQAHKKEQMYSAADRIEQITNQFEQDYGIKDKQDLLAMTALHLSYMLEDSNCQVLEKEKFFQSRLKYLNSLLDVEVI